MSVYTPSRHHDLQVTNIENIVVTFYKHIKKFGCSTVWALHDCNELVHIRRCLMEVQEVHKGGGGEGRVHNHHTSSLQSP